MMLNTGPIEQNIRLTLESRANYKQSEGLHMIAIIIFLFLAFNIGSIIRACSGPMLLINGPHNHFQRVGMLKMGSLKHI